MSNVPNIPSVEVSIEDQSYLQPILSSGRTVLIPFFSKFGDENFQEWSTWDEFKSKFGSVNPRKYGMAQLFIKGASQFTQSFLGKRLLPSDAAFANRIEKFSATGVDEETVNSATDASSVKAGAGNEALFFVGNGRGSGYNDIVLKFHPLDEYTRFYADENGIPRYSFNFLAATVYEKTSSGNLVQLEQNKIPFALVDIDPATGETVKDIYDANSLNIEERFEDISSYINAGIIDDNAELDEYMGPKNLDSVLFWDAEASKAAYIVFEDGNLTIEYINADKSATKTQARFHYKDSAGDDEYAIVTITNGKITIADDTAAGAKDGDLESMHIASSKAFYTFTLYDKGNFVSDDSSVYETTASEGMLTVATPFDCTGAAVIVDDVIVIEGTDYSVNGDSVIFNKPLSYGQYIKIISASSDANPTVVLKQFQFARYNLWKYLIENGVQLESGYDGANLYINGTLNFAGPGTVGQENAKMLLIDFYSTNPELREVLYPKYNFDYIPDFSMDADVQAAIMNLTDYLQTAFGIHSTGVKYNYKQDLDYRRYDLDASSFCNALYSGEANRRHYDSDLGRTVVMPSSYYALLDHLYVDGALDIADPVAGIDKGSLRTGLIKLTYTPTTLEIEKLRMKQINTIIDEPDGVYFIDQLTMYKKASILSRIHAVKPVMQIKKDLRKLLKEVLQSKDGRTATGRAKTIIDTYMRDTVYDAQKNVSGWFEYYKYDIIFDENKLEIKVLLTVKPLRSVEKVSVTIGVV